MNERHLTNRLDHLIEKARTLAALGEAAQASGLSTHRAAMEIAMGELRYIMNLMTAKPSDLSPFAISRAMDRFANSEEMRGQIVPHIPEVRFARDPKWKIAS